MEDYSDATTNTGSASMFLLELDHAVEVCGLVISETVTELKVTCDGLG